MSNKSDGNAFEREFCKILYGYGFWVHNMAQDRNGQPADVIAVNRSNAYLIDCKQVKTKAFDLRRMEDNQISAMHLWMRRCNSIPQFALQIEDQIYMAPFPVLYQMLKTGHSRISVSMIPSLFPTLERWIDECKSLSEVP